MPGKKRQRRGTRVRSSRPVAAAPARAADTAQLEERLQTIIELSSDLYWEQDAEHRFTLLQGRTLDDAGIDTRRLLGKRRWESEHARPVADGGSWEPHRAVLERRLPFTDFRYRRVNASGEPRYISSSGQPVFDRAGRFTGYRGIARDVTERVLLERRLTMEREVTRALAAAGDTNEVSLRVLGAFCAIFGWTCGARWEFDEPTGALRCTDAWGDGSPGIEEFLEVTRGAPALTPHKRGLVRRAFVLGEPVWLADVAGKGSLLRGPSARKAGLRTGLGFPVLADARPVGAVEFYSREPQPFGEELVSAATYLGSSLGQYLQRRRTEEELLRFRAAMDMSGDAVYLIDRAAMRFVDFNQTACHVTGYSREELMDLAPQRLLRVERQELEHIYDRVIAAGGDGIRSESVRFDRNGRATAVEQHRRPLRAGDGWLIVTVSRDISERKRAEEIALRLGRMYAALSATSEAILRAGAPEQLYAAVCEAAAGGARFLSAALFVPENDRQMRAAAVYGSFAPTLRDVAVSLDPAAPDGQGLVATAFRTRASCISGAVLNDPRLQPWRERAERTGIASAVAVPLVRGGRVREVMAFYSGERDAFDAEIVKLLERMAQNIAHALDGLERDAERRHADGLQQLEHAVTRCLAEADSVEHGLACTLSAIGEAQGWEHGQYWWVDEQAQVLRAGSEWLRRGADTALGRGLTRHRHVVFAPGVGLLGHAWQSGQPLWVADAARDPRVLRTDIVRGAGPVSVLIFPVYAKGRVLGMIDFSNREMREPDARVLEALKAIGAQVGQFLQRKRAEDVLRESEARFRALTELSSDWYWELDAEFRLVRFEGRTPANDRHRFQALVGKRPWETDLEFEMGADAFRALHYAHAAFKDAVVVRSDGDARAYFAASGEPVFGPEGEFRGYRGVTRDITRNRLDEERIQYLATHDTLTGLPNRVLFSRLLKQAVQSGRRYQRALALLFIDLDRFKSVNDTLGHAAGDRLLGDMAGRLRACLRSSDVVARVGGDEFVVLLQEVGAPGQVAQVARKLIETIGQPAMLAGREFNVTTSVGIALYPADGEDEQTLMKNADSAMYLAKEQGKNSYRFYTRNSENG